MVQQDGDGQVPLLRSSQGAEDARISLVSASSLTVVSLGLVSMIEYSLVMPSMNEFVVQRLHSTDFMYGCSMATFSLARLLFMPVLGVWSDRRPMLEPFICSIVLGICGNAMYGCAEWADSVWFVLFGRALVGMGAANSTLSMSYMTRITTNKNRTKALTALNGVNLLGIVMGPATNILIDFRWAAPPGSPFHGLVLDKYTNPGWAMLVILLLIGGLLLATFKEPPSVSAKVLDEDCAPRDDVEQASIQWYEARAAAGSDCGEQGSRNTASSHSSASLSGSSTADLAHPLIQDVEAACNRGNWRSVFWGLFWHESLWIHFVISFMSSFVLAELETALPKMTSVNYGWDTLQNSLMYAVIGLMTAAALLAIGLLSKRFSDRAFITFGNGMYGCALALGCVLLRSQPSLAAFASVSTLLIVAAPIVDSPNMAAYSKRLQGSDDAVPFLGLYISLIQACKAVARTAAPLFAGWALMYAPDYTAVYAGPAVIWLLTALATAARFRALEERPMLSRAFSSTSFASFEGFMHSPMMTPVLSP